MTRIPANYQRVRQLIEQSCRAHRREPCDVRLVAVGKRHCVEKVLELAHLGQRDFAENYLQESLEKISSAAAQWADSGENNALCWHFIGHIQSRKCRQIAEHFDWVHTVESVKVAQKLSQNRTPDRPLNILVQLNLQHEESKSGISESELAPLAMEIAALPNLRFRGLMILPRPESDLERQRAIFARCRELLDEIRAAGIDADQLSMGMTDDMEAAIAEGSTMVRIGTALFGPRPG